MLTTHQITATNRLVKLVFQFLEDARKTNDGTPALKALEVLVDGCRRHISQEADAYVTDLRLDELSHGAIRAYGVRNPDEPMIALDLRRVPGYSRTERNVCIANVQTVLDATASGGLIDTECGMFYIDAQKGIIARRV